MGDLNFAYKLVAYVFAYPAAIKGKEIRFTVFDDRGTQYSYTVTAKYDLEASYTDTSGLQSLSLTLKSRLERDRLMISTGKVSLSILEGWWFSLIITNFARDRILFCYVAEEKIYFTGLYHYTVCNFRKYAFY